MRRLLQWLVLLALLVTAAINLASEQGNVQLEWQGMRITLATSLLIGLLIACWLITIWLSTLIAELWIWPERRKNQQILARHQQGLAQLTRAATAMAMGQHGLVEPALDKARSLLNHSPLALLMQAQWLEKQHRSEEAAILYQQLSTLEETASLGLRGLLHAAERKHDYKSALTLAREAHQQFPKDTALTAHTVELMLKSGDITHADALLNTWRARLRLPTSTRRHLRGLIAWHQAEQHSDAESRLQYLLTASSLIKDHAYLPLAVLDTLIDCRHHACLRHIRVAWAKSPSLELTARAIRWLMLQSQDKREKLAHKISKSAPGHLESYILLATISLEGHDPVSARDYALEAIAIRESKRALNIIAQCESQLQDAHQAQPWFIRAAKAPMEEQWQCTQCGAIHVKWQLFCERCNACDSINLNFSSVAHTHIETVGTS